MPQKQLKIIFSPAENITNFKKIKGEYSPKLKILYTFELSAKVRFLIFKRRFKNKKLNFIPLQALPSRPLLEFFSKLQYNGVILK